MIVYDPFWQTLKNSGISQYRLIKEFKVSNGLLDRMRKNKDISLYSINLLCSILHCNVQDICCYVPDEKSK